jgi:hypothetical protein
MIDSGSGKTEPWDVVDQWLVFCAGEPGLPGLSYGIKCQGRQWTRTRVRLEHSSRLRVALPVDAFSCWRSVTASPAALTSESFNYSTQSTDLVLKS